jgi:uncharacterized protein YjiS (DUF1127 family)
LIQLNAPDDRPGQPVILRMGAPGARGEWEAIMTLHVLADWLRRRREQAELDRLSGAEYYRLARDIGVTPSQLDELIAKGHDPRQLPDMLKALGVDEQALKCAEPALLRDMQRTCGVCQAVDECMCEIAAGTAVHNFHDFCSNAPTLDSLKAAGRA